MDILRYNTFFSYSYSPKRTTFNKKHIQKPTEPTQPNPKIDNQDIQSDYDGKVLVPNDNKKVKN